MKALSIKNLTKTYANGNQALKGIDLDVEEGDFYALLGPNGAGKTTAIGIISSLVNKSSGKVGPARRHSTQPVRRYEAATHDRARPGARAAAADSR